ncbi:hypothetical protein ACLMJK_007839 [Lecanora helva]
MGNCSSCLGRRKGSNTETSRLLPDDPYRSQYGTSGQHPQRRARQPDPEAQRREREALESICHSMSDEVVDVFSVLPTPGNGGTNGASKGRSGDRRPETPESSQKYKPSPVSLKQYKIVDEEPSPQEMAYRSVKRAHVRAESGSPKNEGNWEAVKAIMG